MNVSEKPMRGALSLHFEKCDLFPSRARQAAVSVAAA